MSLSMIIAVSDDGVIGMGGKLPWKLKTDMEIFRRLTMGNEVIMGRRTFESIGLPLEGRRNVVVTSNRQWSFPFGVEVYSFEYLKRRVENLEIRNKQMPIIIGGRQLYLECLNAGLIDTIYLTRVHTNVMKYKDDLRDFTRMTDEDLRLSEFKIDGVEHHYPASEKDEYPFTFSKLVRA